MINGIQNNIPTILFQREMSIRDLSRQTGIPYGTLHAIVKNVKKGVTFEQMHSICKALGVDVGNLFQMANEPSGVQDASNG